MQHAPGPPVTYRAGVRSRSGAPLTFTPEARLPRAGDRDGTVLAIAGRAVCVALLLLPLPAHPAPAGSGPLPWQDVAPAALPFLQLPFERPATLPPRWLELSLRAIYANSIASARSPAVDLQYRLETAQPIAALRLGIADGVELQLALPAVSERRGFLDGPIRAVESWLGTGNLLRQPGRVDRQVHFRMVRPDGSGARLERSGETLGDPWLGVKVRLRSAPGAAVALRAAAKAPFAPFPYGSGVAEAAIGLLAEVGAGRTHGWLAADVGVPAGPVTSGRFGTRPHPSLQVAVGRDVGRRATLLVQASAHGSALRPLHLSEIDGWSFYVVLGARLEVAPGLGVGFGVVENLFVTERGADIAGLLELVYHP